MKIFSIVISLQLIVYLNNCKGQSLHNGLYRFTSYDGFFSIKNKENEGKKNFAHLWYKDSCVVIEQRTNYITEEQTSEGNIQKESYPVSRYMYINLKSMICQDYSTFRDTAQPFCNYRRKKTDTIMNNYFFSVKSIYDTLNGVHLMSDTTIAKVNYKRIKILYHYYEYEKSYSVLYLDCRPNNTIFYFNKTLSEIYPGCKVFRSDFCDSTGRPNITSEIVQVKKSLSKTEENIFKCWAKNAANTTLPLISYSEAMNIPRFELEHENPKITFTPYDKQK